MRVLVIAAHPDDEVIGVGGTIRKHVESGDKVFLLIMTQVYSPEWSPDEIEIRKKEVLKAQKILGIEKVFFAGFPTVKLNTIPTIDLTKKIREIVMITKPQIVYFPPMGDLNRDHDIICNAALVVCRPLPRFFIRRVLCYEISPSSRYCLPNSTNHFIPNYYVDISKFMETKLKAMRVYRKELKTFPHPRSLKGLRIFARERGISVGVSFAEAFILIREIC